MTDFAYDAATGLAAPTLAVNLGKAVDYGTGMPFIDIARSMRDWTGYTDDNAKVSYATLKDMGVLDAHGWPTEIPEGMKSITSMFAWSETKAAQAYRAGVYVITWEGEGEIDIRRNVTVLSSEPGRIVVESNGLNLDFSITATDPNGTGDYLRDISIVREEHVELFEAGAVFNPDFLELVQDMRQLRFMDWNSINNSTVVEWDERGRMEDFNWNSTSVPVEVMVRLANETGTDPWFSMPLEASEEYIRNFAAYVRDNLDPRLTATVEYSNENWNFGFDHFKRLLGMARDAWGEDAGSNLGYQYAAKMATKVALTWKEVFAETEDAPGLVNVLGVQTGNPGVTAMLLEASVWQAQEPDDYVRPGDVFDAIGVTTYFGSAVLGVDAQRAELIEALAALGVDPAGPRDAAWDAGFDWLAERLGAEDYRGSVPQILERLAAQDALAEANGLDLISYEGGQHVHQLFGLRGDAKVEAEALGDFLHEFVRSEQMAGLYQQLWEGWSEIGDGPFMQFGSIGPSNKWGSWAVWETLDDVGDNPRGDMLLSWNAEMQAWWDAGQDGAGQDGAGHLQGVTRFGGAGDDVLIGTAEEDYLIGRGGDDFFVAGPGNDHVHGGAGDDALGVAGNAADYRLTEDAEGRAVLVGAEGETTLTAVERIVFADQVMTLDELRAGVAAPAAGPVPVVAAAPAVAVEGLTRLIETVDQTAGAVGGRVQVQTVGDNSRLAQEMADDDGPIYLVSAIDQTATLDGTTVGATWWTLQMNRTESGGVALADTALDAARALAAIVIGADGFTGGDGHDRINGGEAADMFDGGAGRDILKGRGGDDRLTGGADDDRLYGGDGADTFVFASGDGDDRIFDFDAADRLDLTGLHLAEGARLEDFARIDDRGLLTLDFGAEHLRFDGLDVADVEWMTALV